MKEKQTGRKKQSDKNSLYSHTDSPLTTVVRLPESEAGGIGLSTGWQWQVEEQSVCGSWKVKLIQQ